MIPTKHKNELLKALMAEGQDVNKFVLVELVSNHPGGIFEIRLNGTPMYFRVYPANPEEFIYKITYSTFSPTYGEKYSNAQVYNIDAAKIVLAIWLKSEVAKYVDNEDEIDYWKIIKQNPLSIESIDFTKNEPFSLEEKEQLQLGLEEIKLLVAQNLDLNPSEVGIVNQKIDYLIAATKRLNKTDWKGIAISTIINIIYDLSFDEHKRGIFLGLFAKLWAVVQQLPQLFN
jgi:hypothetical protein